MHGDSWVEREGDIKQSHEGYSLAKILGRCKKAGMHLYSGSASYLSIEATDNLTTHSTKEQTIQEALRPLLCDLLLSQGAIGIRQVFY